MVIENFLIAATLYNLNSKLSGARASIIGALDAKHNVKLLPLPFTQLSTMLIQHHSHTSFHGHHHPDNYLSVHDPRAFHSPIDTIEN
jgi:hypothetical protein